VQVFDANGGFLIQWNESGAPYGLFFSGDWLFVADGRATRRGEVQAIQQAHCPVMRADATSSGGVSASIMNFALDGSQ